MAHNKLLVISLVRLIAFLKVSLRVILEAFLLKNYHLARMSKRSTKI